MARDVHRSYHSFDLSELPEGCRTPGTLAFEDAVRAHFLSRYNEPGRLTCVLVKDDAVEVYSFADEQAAMDEVLPRLKAGRLKEAVSMLESLTKDRQAGSSVFYNLGIAYAELGQNDEAVIRLRKVLQQDEGHVHAWVGLANALQALGREEPALEAFHRAVALNPQDGYARRNLGGALLLKGDTKEALEHLDAAYELLPGDERTLYGLALALKGCGQLKQADERFVEYLERFPGGSQVEEVKKQRTELAHIDMRSRAGGGLRMDVVMYLVGAFQTFERFRKSERPARTATGTTVLPSVHRLAMEIALKGRQGLDINDSSKTYRIQALPGEFTGLHLLALMYAAFKELDPSLDVGVDFAQEYEMAKMMFKAGKTKQG